MSAAPAGGRKAWSGRSRGGGAGHALVHAFARLGGPVFCYAMVLPPALWFFATDARARRISMAWWGRVRPSLGRWGRTFMAAWHFHAFARTLADRFLAGAAPTSIRFINRGARELKRGMRHPQGCILLSAHVGAWELAGRWLTIYPGARIHIVMLKAEDPAVQEQVDRAMGDHPFTIIDLRDPFAASLAIAAALRAGDTVCMLGDRSAGDDRNSIAVPFLGAPARFPTGPFLAAAATGAVIVPTFTMKVGLTTYVCEADEPWTVRFSSRAARARELRDAVARWAERLERVVRQHPLQWQNFFDFWQDARERTGPN